MKSASSASLVHERVEYEADHRFISEENTQAPIVLVRLVVPVAA